MSDEKQIPTAIFFADVAGSTQKYEELGDTRAHDLMTRELALITDAVNRAGGTVIKTIGDEVMSQFSSASAAISAARLQE